MNSDLPDLDLRLDPEVLHDRSVTDLAAALGLANQRLLEAEPGFDTVPRPACSIFPLGRR